MEPDHEMRFLETWLQLYLENGYLPVWRNEECRHACENPKECSTSALVYSGAAVVGAADLNSRADGQTNTISAEEGCLSTAVAAKIEVDIGSVLIGACETGLRAQWVSICGAEIVYHDDD
jgi:hypothetical protein